MALPTSIDQYKGYVDLKTFYKTEEVDCFSKVGVETFLYGDKSLLRYYKRPDHQPLSFDLLKGFTPLDERDEGVEGKIKALKRANGSAQAEFVSRRGLLTGICNLPYERNEDFAMAAVRYQGTYYLFDKCEKNSYPGMDKMNFAGHKFEQYVTEDLDGKMDTESPLDLNNGFYTIVKSTLGEHTLLMTNEVDCLERGGDKYVELKTVAEGADLKDSFYFFKLKKIWTQAYLVGTDKVLVGFRDKQNIVRRVKEYKVSEMPVLAAGKLDELRSRKGTWQPSVCLKFLSAFLHYIKQHITEDEAVCWLTRPGMGNVSLRRLKKDNDEYKSLMRIVKGDSD